MDDQALDDYLEFCSGALQPDSEGTSDSSLCE